MLKDMLAAMIAMGYGIRVYDDEGFGVDYDNVRDAMDEIDGVDDAEIGIIDEDGVATCGWALIVNGLDEDERIADCSGVVDRWCSEGE